jgi:hypothetical protein
VQYQQRLDVAKGGQALVTGKASSHSLPPDSRKKNGRDD